MMNKYIFRMDESYPDEGADKAILEAHNGMECYAEINPRYGWRSMVNIKFVDGYENMAFVYELEEVYES